MANDDGVGHRVVGRYALFGPIATGGMARVHWGRLVGPVGFSRVVAVKRLHPQYAGAAEFVAAFIDEARLAARVRHPNVVPIVDVLHDDGELLLVMDYVHGQSLADLEHAAQSRGEPIAPAVAASIACGALHGLHAAHEACDEQGRPLGIVHRDVSPQNVLVGTDGVARVLDFGVATAANRLQQTGDGQIKGKVAYMAPEQVLGQETTRRTDVYACGVVLWEALAGRRLFLKGSSGGVVYEILEGAIDPPGRYARGVPAALEQVVMRAIDRDARKRYATARDFALAIESAIAAEPAWRVGEWVERLAYDSLAARAASLKAIEASAVATGEVARVVSSVDREERAASEPAERTMTDAFASVPMPAPTATVATRPRARRAWAAIALGAATTASLVALAVNRPRGTEARAADPSPSTPAIPVAATTTSTPTATPTSTPTATATSTSSPTARAPRSRASAANCDPPYVLDPSGIRYPKPECIH